MIEVVELDTELDSQPIKKDLNKLLQNQTLKRVTARHLLSPRTSVQQLNKPVGQNPSQCVSLLQNA
jgi:hypothetical protein